MQNGPIIDSLEKASSLGDKPVHLAIGMFDGVHRGHQSVIGDAKLAAQADGGRTVVLTFTPHPSRFLRPENPTRLLMDDATKFALLLNCGADAVIAQPFDAHLAGMEAAQFVPWLKGHLPTLKSIHVGRNFRFGKGREGTPALLGQTAKALGVMAGISLPVLDEGDAVSSTRIRGCVREGRMEEAVRMLAHPYGGCATVIPGRQLGRTLGVPTLNLLWEPDCRPRYGVYAVTVNAPDDTAHSCTAVANYGLRPTVEQNAAAPLLEVHVLDAACPWTTGDTLCVAWHGFIRAEMKFPMLSALQAQMEADKAAARLFFANAR